MNKENNEKERELNIKWYTFVAELAVPVTIFVVDYLMIVLAEAAAYAIRESLNSTLGVPFVLSPIYEFVIIPAVFLFFLHTNSVNPLGKPFWQMMRQTFWDVLYGVAIAVLLMYLGHIANTVSRLFVCLAGVFIFCFITIGRFIAKQFMGHCRYFQLPVIFVGAGRTAERVVRSFNGDSGFGYRIVGFIDDNPVSETIPQHFRILGGFDDADKIIRRLGVKHVIITAPGVSEARQVQMINRIQPYVKQVSFVPDIIGAPGNLEIVSLADADMMLINVRNNLAHWYNRLLKRVFDIVCCLLGMVVFVPLTLILGLAIYLDDPGPVFFAHRRIGKNGKEFPCYKFRTMCINAEEELKEYLAANPAAREEWERDYKLKDDPRITGIGSFLRKTSLDELPQIVNVIKGEMSLVGPRPIIRAEIEKYGDNIADFYLVRPGITGVWQVSGRSDTTYEERVAMDSWYVHNWTMWMDIAYLWKTISVVLGKKGAY